MTGSSHGKGVTGSPAPSRDWPVATKASLQRPYSEQILTPTDLYKFCETNIKGIAFKLITIANWENEEANMKKRFAAAQTVKGTLKLHRFTPNYSGISF